MSTHVNACQRMSTHVNREKFSRTDKQRHILSCAFTAKSDSAIIFLVPDFFRSDFVTICQADHEWTEIKVEAVLVSAIIMPGKPRGIVQTIHNMGALYKHLHHVRDKRMVRTIGITYPHRYFHG